jgi:hypothetical protein
MKPENYSLEILNASKNRIESEIKNHENDIKSALNHIEFETTQLIEKRIILDSLNRSLSILNNF